MSMENRYLKLKQLNTGWANYFKIANMKSVAQELDAWIRRRIRMCYLKQWKKNRTKYENFKRLGIPDEKAWTCANSRKGYWRLSDNQIINRALNNKTLEKLGYTSLSSICC